VSTPLIGVQLNTTQRLFRWSEIRELAIAAEDLGLDSLWTEDHLFYKYSDEVVGPWEAWTVLAALADITQRVRIGSLVSPIGLRHPAMLVKMAETVDEISDGRLVLGFGLGWSEDEHRAVGATLEGRLEGFAQSMDVMLAAFREGFVDFRGSRVRAEQFHLMPRGPRSRPELLVGSMGPRTLRVALPHVDGWNWDGFRNEPERFAKASLLIDETCRQVGRDPASITRSAHLVVKLNDAEGLPIDPLPDDFKVIGPGPAQIAESFAAFREAGADELQLIIDPARPAALEIVAEAVSLL
jgi:alkanesulfonate monooxygenase SsuD/methylene tetrahydromethanopterin reductase-like flavin-dependent oxidoreductase (luciferase family)